MFQRSRTLVPLIRTCCGVCKPVEVQSRNIWDLVRAPDARSIFREMERLERMMHRNFPISFMSPRLIPIEGEEMRSKTYRTNIDVDGFKPEDIKISVKNKIMRVEAKMDRTSDDGSRLQQSFVREFTIPENIDLSTLKSFLHNDGVLCIEADLTKTDGPRDIPIQHEDCEVPKSKM